ncbi:MAG TPA: hypothetical protein DCM71_19330 [Runella sp.]|nr:hypothetical protein [Runella sp.]
MDGRVGNWVSLLLWQISDFNDVNPPIPVKSLIPLLEMSKDVRLVAGKSSLLASSIQVGHTSRMAPAKALSVMVWACVGSVPKMLVKTKKSHLQTFDAVNEGKIGFMARIFSVDLLGIESNFNI